MRYRALVLIAPCPSCGRPTPARLATPELLRCAACGYDGPPPEPARAHLVAAHRQLLAADAGSRQLSAVRRQALSRNEARRFALVFLVSSSPTTLVFASAIRSLRAFNSGSDRTTSFVVASVVFALMWGAGATAYFLVRRRQALLRAICAASPPARTGDPATCRVCGADLPAGESVVRCSFCAADNFAAPTVAARIMQAQRFDVARYREAIAHAAASTRRAGSSAGRAFLGAALGLPLASAILLSELEPLLMRVERDLDERVLYSTAIAREGECYGRLVDDGGDARLDFGQRLVLASPLGPIREVATIPPGALVGRAVVTGMFGEIAGTIERVYGSPLGNLGVVRTREGKAIRVDLRGVCFDAPARSVVLHGGVPESPVVSGADLFHGEFSGEVIVSRTDGTDARAIAALPRMRSPTVIAPDPATLFVGDSLGSPIWAIPRAGGEPHEIARTQPGQDLLRLAASPRAGGRLIVSGPRGALTTMDKDGANATELASPFDLLWRVAVDGDDAFASGTVRGSPWSALFVFHGASARGERVASGCEAFAVDANAVYCGHHASVVAIDRATHAERTIWELPPPVLPPSGYVEEIRAIAVDDDDVWFVYEDSHTFAAASLLVRAPKRPGTRTRPRVVATGLPRPGHSLYATADGVFVSVNRTNQFGDEEIRRIGARR